MYFGKSPIARQGFKVFRAFGAQSNKGFKCLPRFDVVLTPRPPKKKLAGPLLPQGDFRGRYRFGGLLACYPRRPLVSKLKCPRKTREDPPTYFEVP